MLDRISKREYESNPQVRQAITDIMTYYENRVFFDIEIRKYVRFNYSNNSLVVIPVV